MFETRGLPPTIFRIGRKPDPWDPPDWSRAQTDGTFGNRFDDPHAYYRVLYAASQKLSCFLETLARFRQDPLLMAELSMIEGDNDFFPLGEVPIEWCERRLLGAASGDGCYGDICAPEWVAYLRRRLAGECLRLGLSDLNASVLQSQTSRRITQLASFEVYRLEFAGIYYRSRFSHELENWALFEPFRITPSPSHAVLAGDPILLEALRALGLKLRKV